MANTLKFGNGEWYGKKDTILAYNDENDNYKPLPFDFSRGSSATVVNKDGLIETVGSGEPRIDYKDDSKGALLLEPSRTNILTYSEDFSNSSIWRRVTVNSNLAISPDGTLNADKLNDSTDNNSHYIALDSSFSLGSYSASIFAKKGTLNYLYIWFTGFNGVFDEEKVWFDLDNGTVGTTQSPIEANIEDYGNGWFRCSAKSTADIATSGRIAFGLSNSDNVSSFTGTGNDNIYLWGAQIEQGSYATSYIPTQGGVVTRLADTCNNGGNEQVINSTEGVLYGEIANISSSGGDGYISLSSGSALNRATIRFTLATNNLACQYVIGGANQTSMDNVLTDRTEFNKIAFKFKENDFAVWVNGVELSTHLIGSTLASGILNKLSFDNGSAVANFYGNIKDLRVYNTALTDQELQALTSN